jgi:hypothetical protein
VFFGHYWAKDRPAITAPSAACLDFSVAKERYLAAYIDGLANTSEPMPP